MTKPIDYDDVAPDYDRRFERNRWDGVETALERFIDGPAPLLAGEVGCGTGHWLAFIDKQVRMAVGLDRSREMLQRAREAAPRALLVRGRAEKLPWRAGSFDRLFCINALHHFDDARAFMIEARRVLRSDGALLTVGLDPHTGLDRWWIYDYIPAALEADRKRYLPGHAIRSRLEAAGFAQTKTEVAQHIGAEVPFERAMARGMVERSATSQLMVVNDEDYQAGLRQLIAEQPVLRSDLRVYATIGWIRPQAGRDRG